MKLMRLYISLLIICFTSSCRDSSKNDTESTESITTILNLNDQEIEIDSINSFVEQKMAELQIPGVSYAIINDAKVVYHDVKGYADKEAKTAVTEKTIFEGASLSKPLFAYLTMFMVEDGLLDLDKPLYQYLENPDIAYDERYKEITARMVLSHCTGLPNWRTDFEDNKLFLKFDPGTDFNYSGEGYQYLALVLEKLLNTDYRGLESFYQNKIAIPLQMDVTKFIQDDSNLNAKAEPYKQGEKIPKADIQEEFGAAYGIHSEAKDFSKWLIALMENKGLTGSSYEELFKDQFIIPEGSPYREEGVTAWTLGFAKAEIGANTLFGHGGNNPGYTSLFLIDTSKKWGMVLFTNANQVSEFGIQMFLYINEKS